MKSPLYDKNVFLGFSLLFKIKTIGVLQQVDNEILEYEVEVLSKYLMFKSIILFRFGRTYKRTGKFNIKTKTDGSK